MCVTCAIRLARVRRVITARHQRFPSELSLARDRHARAAAAVALARSLYRARGVAVAVAVAVGYDARQSCHAHHAVHALLTHTPRHRRASRASSPFPVPPTIGTRAAAVAALARSLSRARCGGGGDGGSRLRRASIVSHASHSPCITHTHIASSPRVARVITVPVPPAHDRLARCGGGGARSLARSIARARCGGGDSGGGRSRRASRVPRATRARARVMNTRPAHHHCFHSSMSPTRARGR